MTSRKLWECGYALLGVLVSTSAYCAAAQHRSYSAVSPDGLNEVRLEVGEDGMNYSVWRRCKAIVEPAQIGPVESVPAGHPQIVMTPFTATVPGAGVVCVTESDLREYPGLNFYRRRGEPDTLRSWQAGVPKEVDKARRKIKVVSREPYLAKTNGTRVFPWRVFVLGDAPTQYRVEPECTAFITKVPTVWDETRGVAGEIGKYAAVARRKGSEWWLGTITNWEARELELPTAFLGGGQWTVEAFEDASDAGTNAEHYVRRECTVKAGEPIKVRLAPGGGFAAHFKPAMKADAEVGPPIIAQT